MKCTLLVLPSITSQIIQFVIHTKETWKMEVWNCFKGISITCSAEKLDFPICSRLFKTQGSSHLGKLARNCRTDKHKFMRSTANATKWIGRFPHAWMTLFVTVILVVYWSVTIPLNGLHSKEPGVPIPRCFKTADT